LTKYAIAIQREDGTLVLFLRVVRSPSGIYVVFAAGQDRPGHDPHSSWHRDGRVHHKSFEREFIRRRGQALASLIGTEPFVTTSVTRDAASHLPHCDPVKFDSVVEIPAQLLNDPPNRTQVHVELLAVDAVPAVPVFEHRLVERSVINDEMPAIGVSFYDSPLPKTVPLQ